METLAPFPIRKIMGSNETLMWYAPLFLALMTFLRIKFLYVRLIYNLSILFQGEKIIGFLSLLLLSLNCGKILKILSCTVGGIQGKSNLGFYA
jgi:hypothetical protein